MFNSTVLEVAIGMVFCFASVSLVTSSIFEALASWLNLRSKTLLAGLRKLLNANTPAGEALLLKVYNHALAHPTGSGTAVSLTQMASYPSYIDPKNFAQALIDAVRLSPDNAASLRADLNAVVDPQIRQLLIGLYERNGGNLDNFRADVAAWFESGMDRVSGSYKRQSQFWCFGLALVLAGAFNIDCINLFKTLWQHPGLLAQVGLPATNVDAASAIAKLNDLPIGWKEKWEYISVIGWFITATATLFGAPFWFDLLQKLVRIRGTGPKPAALPTAVVPQPVPAVPQPANRDAATERNAIIDLHAELNKTDESYRPVSSGERW